MTGSSQPDAGLLARALRATPGASQTRSKAPGNVGPRDVESGYPLFATHGTGAYVYDSAGRRYLDCFGANAAIPLGYGRPEVAAAVHGAAAMGPLLSLPSPIEAEVSERFLSVCAPWASQVRWLRTGSEATHAAYKIAKKATGRDVVLVGDSGNSYHGWHEWCGSRRGDKVMEYGHCADLDQLPDPEDVAAVFVEPHRWKPVDATWLCSVRLFCDRIGALLVFDEMVYGLRWAKGGGAEFYGVTPDVACFGKALGNGVPVSCVCGTAEAMAHTVDAGVSGTYGGDLIGLSAADAVLRIYQREDVVRALWVNGGSTWRGFGATAPPGATLEGCEVHWRLKVPGDDPAILDRALLLAAQAGVLVHRASNNASAAMTKEEATLAGRVLGSAVERAVVESNGRLAAETGMGWWR